jgi:hypothetical protein
MVSVNASGVQSIDQLGSDLPLPGRYHAIVKAISDKKEKYPDTIITEFGILNGTNPGQEGKSIRVFFGTTESWMLERLTRFFMAVGLISPGEKKDIDPYKAVGRQLLIEVEDKENKKEKNMYRQVSNNGMWQIGHPKHTDIPTDKTMLQVHQVGGATGQGGASPSSAPTASPPPGGQPATVGTGAGSAKPGWEDV